MIAQLLHATAIAIDGNGVLLLGPSGAGKSDLALRLIDRGAKLVSDDAVPVDCSGASPILTAAQNIQGKLEVRGIGICAVSSAASAPLRLAVELDSKVERLPSPGRTTTICGYDVPLVSLAPFEASAPIKLECALRSVVDADLWPVAKSATLSCESNRV